MVFETYGLAMAIGVVAGLRSMTAPAAVAWAARTGALALPEGLAFLGHGVAPWILALLAGGELVVDKLPATPPRTVLPGFAARLVTGGFAGGMVAASSGSLVVGVLAGAAGAVAGTLGGVTVRMWLARRLGRDLPAALIEDGVALVAAFVIITISAR
ncbi:MAG: DUF4126 domain-containing protein [Vicinamibacterales bacterium]